jgi:hypothetical protein
MALVVLVSAKGAPGVTTLTVALAALTPGAVAADLDPDGGDLGLRYRRPDGAPLDAELGLLSLAAGLRRDLPGHRWLPSAGADPLTGVEAPEGPTRLEDHLQVTGGGLDLLLGVNGPEQAVGLGPLWSPLARALSEAGRTIYADCGRVGPAAPTMPVLHQADAIIVVARPEVEELAHLRERLRFLNSAVPGRFAGRAQIGVVLVAPERDRAVAGRTEQLLHSSGVGVPVLGTMAEDQKGAEALRGMNRSRLSRSTLIRSVRSLLPSVSLLAGTIPELTAPVPAPPRASTPAPKPTAPTAPAAPTPPARTTTRTPKPEVRTDAAHVGLFTEAAGKTVEPTPVPVPIPVERPAEPPVEQAAPIASEAQKHVVELPPIEEQTLPLRRRSNSFFGDAPPVEEDPTLLPLTVAPGVFTPQIQIAQEIPAEEVSEPAQPIDAFQQPAHRATGTSGTPGAVRGFAGLNTPPEGGARTEGHPTADELRHNRSRRAAFGRDPGTLYTSERRRSRRHVMPTEGNETSYEAEAYGNGVGTWLQENRRDASGPIDLYSEVRTPGRGIDLSDPLGLGEPGPKDEVSTDEAPTPLEPLPRREPQSSAEARHFSDSQRFTESRGFADHTEPPTAPRSEGTGWIAPDVPPSALPSIPSAVPTSLPSSANQSSTPDPLGGPPVRDLSPMSADRAALLRDIRDRARLGTDGSGTWAGHTGSQSIVRETQNLQETRETRETRTEVRPSVPTNLSTSAPAESPTGTAQNASTGIHPNARPGVLPSANPIDIPAEASSGAQAGPSPYVRPSVLPAANPIDVPPNSPTGTWATGVPPHALGEASTTSATKPPADIHPSSRAHESTRLPTSAHPDVPSGTRADIPLNVPSRTPVDAPTAFATNAPADLPASTGADESTHFPTNAPANQQSDPPTSVPTHASTDFPPNTRADESASLPTDTATSVQRHVPSNAPATSSTRTWADEPASAPANVHPDARLGTDPTDALTGDWDDRPAGSSANVQPDVRPDTNPTAGPRADVPTGVPTYAPANAPRTFATDVPKNVHPESRTDEHDVDTAILRPVRDPYEPIERDDDTPEGGR